MEIIIDIILPVFGVVAIGFAAAKLGLFDRSATRGLSLFVFNFAIPLLLSHAWLQSRANDLIDSVEMAAIKFLNSLGLKG